MDFIVKSTSLSNLLKSLKNLEEQYQIYCPVKEDDAESYMPLKDIKESQLESVEKLISDNEPPLNSIKSFVFSNTETYLEFHREKDRVEFSAVATEQAPKVILGCKPCDVESLSMIDKVFLQQPVDTLYQKKRESTILISSVCNTKGANCFCDEFAVDKTCPKAADILLIEGNKCQAISQDVYLQSISEKGEAFLKELLKQDGIEKVQSKPELSLEENVSKDSILCPEDIQAKMEELYDSEIWQDLAMRCLGCGICAYYCPTCHCYDINDYYRKNQGVRYRSWDSCMFSNFTNMAGGHNPRPTKADRIKNRFFHKLNYFVKKQGPIACVGCGRCAKHCPAGISINTVLNKIGGHKDV